MSQISNLRFEKLTFTWARVSIQQQIVFQVHLLNLSTCSSGVLEKTKDVGGGLGI